MLAHQLQPQSQPIQASPEVQGSAVDDQCLYGNAELLARCGLDRPAAGIPGPAGPIPGWATEDPAALTPGAVGDLFGFGDAEAPGQPVPAGGCVPPEVVAWVDGQVPPGLGVALSGNLNLGIGLVSGTGEASITATNQGEGWLEVEASVAADAGPSFGVGAMLIKTGAVASATIAGGGKVTRTFRVPWTRLVDPATLAGLAGTVALGELGNRMEAAPLLGSLIGDHDLGEYLIAEKIEVGASGNLNGEAGLGGEQVGLDGTVAGAVSVSVEYEDLADTAGRRTGHYQVEGEASAVIEALGHLEETLGVDLSGTVTDLSESCAVVVPFTEEDGDKTFGTPYLQASVDVGAGPGSIGATVEAGPDHRELDLRVAVTEDQPLWDEIDRIAASFATGLTGGALRMDGSSTVTAELSITLDGLPASDDLGADLTGFVKTGQLPPALADAGALVQQAIAAADLEVGVDATLISADLAGQLTGDAVGEASGSAELEGAVVFQRDDVLPDLDHPPTADDLIALIRSASSLLTHPA